MPTQAQFSRFALTEEQWRVGDSVGTEGLPSTQVTQPFPSAITTGPQCSRYSLLQLTLHILLTALLLAVTSSALGPPRLDDSTTSTGIQYEYPASNRGTTEPFERLSVGDYDTLRT